MKPLYFLLFFALILILGGADRGFDITDEGLYALLAHPLQENQAGVFNYDLFFKGLFQIFSFQFGLVELRILRLVCYFLGAYGLAVFLRNIFKAEKIRSFDFQVSLFGLFAGYSFLPQSLSYNHLTVVLACCWLALISGEVTKSKTTFLIGLILGVLVYVKISTAFLLALVSGFFIFSKRPSFKQLGLIVLPYFLLELIFYFLLDTSASIRLWSGMGMMMGRQEYALATLFKHTLVGIFWIGLAFGGTFTILKWAKYGWWRSLGIIALSLFLFWITHITEEWNHVVLILSAQIFAFISFWQREKLFGLELEQSKWILLLIILPFILHFGSNVYWLRIGIHYWVFWIVAFWILLKSAKGFQEKSFGFGLGILSCVLIFTGIWWKPFEQKSLWKSRVSWEYLPGKKIKLMPEQIQKLRELQSEAEINSQVQILAAYRISGIPFLLGKTMPKSPGFWDQDQLKTYFPDSLPDVPLIFNPISELPYSSGPSPILLTEF